jgi:peptide deformylase
MPAKQSLALPLPDSAYALTEDDLLRASEEADLGMIAPQDARLSQVSQTVSTDKIQTDAIQAVIARLFIAAKGQRMKRPGMARKRRTLVGLAAPQIGELVRIIVVDTEIDIERKHPGKLECFVNPEIVWRSRETAEGREGCFSTGPVWGLVRRPVAIKVRALDQYGRVIERIFEGFTARIFQHEIDHLEGIRFPDRIKSDRKRHWVHTEELAYYVKHTKQWKRICSKAQWEALKRPLTPSS